MRRRRSVTTCLALALALAVPLTACGSSPSGTDQKASGDTIKIGLLTELSGPAASGFTTTKRGVQAYVDYVNSKGGVNGQKISISVGDTTGTPTGALTAAQKLVQHDNVFAIVENSSVSYGAEPYLLKAGIPIIGTAIDGPIWGDKKNTNLIAAPGYVGANDVLLANGRFVKAQGGTSCASLGYADSVSAQKSAESFIASCQKAGLKKGYLNTQVPSSTTDVGGIALAIKKSGADAVSTALRPNTAFALIGALKQLGVAVKVNLLYVGYGSDLLASPPSVQVAQGAYFATLGYPAEVHNTATDLRRTLLSKLGAASPPTFGDQYGYLAAVAMVDILKATGSSPSRADFLKTAHGISDFTGDGLLPYKVNFGTNTASAGCIAATKLTGKAFVPVAGTPLCAGVVKLDG
jgi:branched-chain amino acid transport system substrate-binding protein